MLYLGVVAIEKGDYGRQLLLTNTNSLSTGE